MVPLNDEVALSGSSGAEPTRLDFFGQYPDSKCQRGFGTRCRHDRPVARSEDRLDAAAWWLISEEIIRA